MTNSSSNRKNALFLTCRPVKFCKAATEGVGLILRLRVEAAEVGFIVIIIGTCVEFMIYFEFVTIVEYVTIVIECVIFCDIDGPMVVRTGVECIAVKVGDVLLGCLGLHVVEVDSVSDLVNLRRQPMEEQRMIKLVIELSRLLKAGRICLILHLIV